MNFTIAILVFAAICVFLMLFAVANLFKNNNNTTETKEVKGFINKMNQNNSINQIGNVMPSSNLEVIFNRAKNPWKMTIATFQTIRLGGFIICLFAGLLLGLVTGIETTLFCLGIGILFLWYPMYYYKAIGNEREMEWNKMYEFIWVIKHNITFYDPAKAYLNTMHYIKGHAPHNKEIIQGFHDFYKYWNNDGIDPYIQKYYPFSVTREITQIVYNMYNTGQFPEQELDSLRSFIINAQDLTVEKTLSGVSGKATIYSLPFLMVSVIISLMIPLIFQIVQFL